MSRAVMQQALEALELLARYEHPLTKVQVRKPRDGGPVVTVYPQKVALEAITALKQALAESEQPVARLKRGTTGRCTRRVCECEKEGLGLECIWLEPMIDGYPLWSGIPTAKQQKPVAWTDGRGFIASHADLFPRGTTVSPLYAHQPTPRKPLTDEVIAALWSWSQSKQAEATATTQQHAFARAIEAAHGIGEQT